MSTCRNCGSELKWKRLANGKWCPTNIDGSDHWDLCASLTRKADGPVVKFFVRTGGAGYVWCGDVPPWDESLGSFREFTEREMQEGLVCEFRR